MAESSPNTEFISAVTHAVRERLGNLDDALLETVAVEVARAVAQPTTTAGHATDNGDGTITTALGAVIPRPNADTRTLATCAGCVQQVGASGERAVITATGRNRRGVLAALASAIADAGGDFADVSQTIISDFFTLIMIVNTHQLTCPLEQLRAKLNQACGGEDISIVVMHEDVMQALQRV